MIKSHVYAHVFRATCTILFFLATAYVLHTRASLSHLGLSPALDAVSVPGVASGRFQAASHSNFLPHPIEKLVAKSSQDFQQLLAFKTIGKEAAASAYRERRGRHPPPLFDAWVAWAEDNDAVMIESFFDQIYDDLEPFWAIEPAKIRADAASWSMVISIRNGSIAKRSTIPPSMANWIGKWMDLLEHIPSDALPDVDLALNPDDEPHLFVPWNDIRELLLTARAKKHMRSPNEATIISTFSRYAAIPEVPTFEQFSDAPSERDIWKLARDTCNPEANTHMLEQDSDFTVPVIYPEHFLSHMEDGYIANWTAAKSICANPHLRDVEGYFVNAKQGTKANWRNYSTDRQTTRMLFPLLSACKLQGVNNEILVPSAMYWGDIKAVFEDDPLLWSDKVDKANWRGSASGGFNNETNWTRFQRHRFISMANGTQVDMTEASAASFMPAHLPGGDPPLPHNYPKPWSNLYDLAALRAKGSLGEWIDSFADVAFTRLNCWPPQDYYKNNNGTTCWYTSAFYNTTQYMALHDSFRAKYLPDIDGTSYSGRWRSFLLSNSVPIKATVWNEWHDSRLLPWQHFVPMDNTFMDWWGIMQYFVGYQPLEGSAEASMSGHDHVARAIAENGRYWSRKVLRHEDMILYFWRVILEYARICDDQRENLGWVDDLL